MDTDWTIILAIFVMMAAVLLVLWLLFRGRR